jgi:hypothetical protein
LISLSRTIKPAAPQAVTQKATLEEIAQPTARSYPVLPRTQPGPPAPAPIIKPGGNPSKNPRPSPVKTDLPTGSQNAMDIDWLTWGLILLAVITLGGLIPFWVWIYLLYNPPGR